MHVWRNEMYIGKTKSYNKLTIDQFYEMMNEYPAPSKVFSKLKIDTAEKVPTFKQYCVAGAYMMYTFGMDVGFPGCADLYRLLGEKYVNIRTERDNIIPKIRKIFNYNDNGDFENAWNALFDVVVELEDKTEKETKKETEECLDLKNSSIKDFQPSLVTSY